MKKCYTLYPKLRLYSSQGCTHCILVGNTEDKQKLCGQENNIEHF